MEEKSCITTEIRELQAEIDKELEAKSARVSDLEWKEQLAQLREDLLRTSRRLVEARNSEAEKKPNGTTAGWILVNRATKSKDQL